MKSYYSGLMGLYQTHMHLGEGVSSCSNYRQAFLYYMMNKEAVSLEKHSVRSQPRDTDPLRKPRFDHRTWKTSSGPYITSVPAGLDITSESYNRKNHKT